MRYWIWLNDLVQGPFEPDELLTLHAFNEEMLVCMVGREEWIPAGRVADLASAIAQLKAKQEQPLAPPPPPPKRPPLQEPLQGEFFIEPPGQQHLLESGDETTGPFAYHPSGADVDVWFGNAGPVPRVTMPFSFVRPSGTGGTLELRAAPPLTELTGLQSQALITESPVRQTRPSADQEAPPITRVPLNIVEVEPPVSEIPPLPQTPPIPEIKPSDMPVPAGAEREPEPPSRAGPIEAVPDPLVNPEALPARQAMAGPSPAAQASVRGDILPADPALEDAIQISRQPRWLPWFMAVSALLFAIGSLGYWLLDRANTRSAIAEAGRLENPMPAMPPKPIASTIVEAPTPSPGPVVPMSGISPRAVPPPAKKAAPRMAKPARMAATDPASAAGQKIRVSKTSAPKNSGGIKPALVAQSAIPSPKAPVPMPIRPAKTLAVPGLAPVPVKSPPDIWINRQNDAIQLVMEKKLPNSKVTVGEQSRALLQEMHEKELLHAARTGERLYLPDKLTWSALREDGARYRVYLTFFAWQPNGERIQARSYQFVAQLDTKSVQPDDTATRQDLLGKPATLTFQHNPMAADIESILGGVDTVNKHTVRMKIISDRRKNRKGRQDIHADLQAAQTKLQRAVVYFRKTYNEKALQNVARAYGFMELLKG